MSVNAGPTRKGLSKTSVIGLLAVVFVIGAIVVYARSGSSSPHVAGPDLSVSIPTAPPVPAGPVPHAGPPAVTGTQAAVSAANSSAAGIGQVLISWFLVADLALALVALFPLLLSGLLHFLHFPRVLGRAVLVSVGLAEVIFVLAPVALVLILRLWAWGGALLMASTSPAAH